MCPGRLIAQHVQNRELKKQLRLLRQESEVLSLLSHAYHRQVLS